MNNGRQAAGKSSYGFAMRAAYIDFGSGICFCRDNFVHDDYFSMVQGGCQGSRNAKNIAGNVTISYSAVFPLPELWCILFT
jgi:hypothetical protein